MLNKKPCLCHKGKAIKPPSFLPTPSPYYWKLIKFIYKPNKVIFSKSSTNNWHRLIEDGHSEPQQRLHNSHFLHSLCRFWIHMSHASEAKGAPCPTCKTEQRNQLWIILSLFSVVDEISVHVPAPFNRLDMTHFQIKYTFESHAFYGSLYIY